MKIQSKTLRLISSIALCQMAGVIGSIATSSAIPSWYTTLQKPNFTPPNWLFAPIWLTLYTMMGISLFLIWQKKNKKLINLFLFHLTINTLWSLIFFGLKELLLALVVILILWSLILTMIIKFKKVNPLASYLLIPYLLWVSLATALNFSIWQLN